MSASILPISTPQKPDGDFVVVPVEAATLIPAGVLAAANAAGNLVNAADAAGLSVIGRAEDSYDNSAGPAAAIEGTARRGVFKYANSATHAVTNAQLGKTVFVEDNQTVAASSTNSIPAGICTGIDDDGGIWVDTKLAAVIYIAPVVAH